MKILENGAAVLLEHDCRDGSEIVLAIKSNGRGTGEYVTWRTKNGHAFSGNYFQDRQIDAVKDWLKRVGEQQDRFAEDMRLASF